MKLFETIKTKEEHKQALDALSGEIEIARQALLESAFALRKARLNLITGIKRLYPETAGYDVIYDHENRTITAVSEK